MHLTLLDLFLSCQVVDTTAPQLKLGLPLPTTLIVDFNPLCNASNNTSTLPCYQRIPEFANKTIISTVDDIPIIVTDAVTQDWAGLVAVQVQVESRLLSDVNASAVVGSAQIAQFIASDLAGNHATLNISMVVADTWLPRLVLLGDANPTLKQDDEFDDPGWFADDIRDGNLTLEVSVSSEIDTSVPGVYVLLYTVADSSNNTAEAIRIVTILASRTTRSPPSGSASSQPTNLGLIAGAAVAAVLLLVLLVILALRRSRPKSSTLDSANGMFINPTYLGQAPGIATTACFPFLFSTLVL